MALGAIIKRDSAGGSYREMNLDYRLAPAKCGLALQRRSKKHRIKTVERLRLFNLSGDRPLRGG